MARIKIWMKPFNKKGQLFLLEVFIALSVLILLMLALYQVEFTTIPTYRDDLSQLGYDTLEALNTANELKPLVYNLQTNDLALIINEVLPDSILWRLSVSDGTGDVVFQIYWDREPPSESAVGVTDYILYGYLDHISRIRIIHLELWQMVG